jgi:hypothetical protein
MKLTKSLSASKKSADIVPASPEHSLKPLDWKTIMHEWESSGLPQREFCEKKSLAYTSFMYQRNRIKKSKSATSSMLPIKLLPLQQASAPMPTTSCFVIQWPNGIRLSIPPHADTATLKSLLIFLEHP